MYGVETLWAAHLGDDLYELRNVPFLAYGYSELDVVTTVEVDGRRFVTGKSCASGHSTYRLILPVGTDAQLSAEMWRPLQELGCTYERANRRLIAIDVPPRTDVYAVYRVLEGEREQSIGNLRRAIADIPFAT